MKKTITIIMVTCLMFFSMVMAGDANFNEVTGTKSLALGGLYYAGPDEITSAFSNPSRVLVSSGFGFSVHTAGKAGRYEYRKENNDLHRSHYINDFGGSAGLYWMFSPNAGIATLYNRVHDYSVRWPLALIFNVNNLDRLYGFEMISETRTDVISQVFGLKVKKLSIGFAVSYYDLKQHFAYPMLNSDYPVNKKNPAYSVDLKLQGNAYGFSSGFMFPLSPSLQVGGAVRSSVQWDTEGKAKTDFFAARVDSLQSQSNITGNFKVPVNGGLGFLYRMNDQFNLNCDISADFWEDVPSKINIEYSDTGWTSRMNGVDADSVIGFSWTHIPFYSRNSFSAGIGMEYIPNDELAFRFGYRYQSNPNDKEAYSFLFPTVSQHILSSGIRFVIYEKYMIDLGIAYAIGTKVRVKETDNNRFPGTYKAATIIPSMNLRYTF